MKVVRHVAMVLAVLTLAVVAALGSPSSGASMAGPGGCCPASGRP
jgi:hypothetical protein